MAKEFKTPEKKAKTTTNKIADFLTTTGFIFEMEISKLLEDCGYTVFPNRYFFDHDENKKREIDIVASKTVNNINIVFVIECKQNAAADWIFVCSDKKPSRYYNFVKFFPSMSYKNSIEKTRIFDDLRSLDSKLPLAQNSTIMQMPGKKSDSKEIYECILKLPKAIIGLIEDIGRPKNKRTVFFPIAVFSGQIFKVEYKSKLKVEEVDAVQYASSLDSDNYKYNFSYNRLTLSFTNENDNNKKENNPAATINKDLGSNYLIEFVTKKGIESFISDVERRVTKIDLKLWPIEDVK